MARDEIVDLLSQTGMTAADWIGRLYWRHFKIRKQRSPHMPPVKIIAHRGAWKLSGHIENTLPALLAATKAGCWGVEFDVRALKDGTLVVHHDDSLVRTFGRELRLSQISLSHLRHEAPLIPTLTEVIQALGGQAHLMIELKGSSNDWEQAQLTQLQTQLSGLTCGRDFHLMSLDTKLLQFITEQVPEYRMGIVCIATTEIQSVSEVAQREKWAALTAHWLLLPQTTIDSYHKRNQLCGTGYADSKEVFLRECARDIDWIFTNHGHVAPTWLEAKSRPL
ncbi:MAG: glycerophosphodiester phosphodiesterase [Bdellovibrionales bacterium]|nr:glycerophosphodiester phosphodiesterase [Bdellovibrionales bacterium]